jgi:hypothetical protein
MQTSSAANDDDWPVARVLLWPDPGCLAAGSQHVVWAVRCLAAAGLSDEQIPEHLKRLMREVLLP